MAEPPDPTRTVTVAEANRLLPKVVPLIEQLQGLQRSIIETNGKLESLTEKVSGGNGHPIQSLKEQIQDITLHQLQLVEAFQSALEQLEALGCFLKDLQLGLVDFYTMRQGELVYLCWKLGEARIQFWHTLEGGYSARQPLD